MLSGRGKVITVIGVAPTILSLSSSCGEIGITLDVFTSLARKDHQEFQVRVLTGRMLKRKQRLCKICKKRLRWIGGDVKNPGPVCKRCYHKYIWPQRKLKLKLKQAKLKSDINKIKME